MSMGEWDVLLNVSGIHGLPPPYEDHTLHNPMLQTLHVRRSSQKFYGIFNRLLVIIGCVPRPIPLLESCSKGLTCGAGVLNGAESMSVEPAV